jgi:hypothetical protein
MKERYSCDMDMKEYEQFLSDVMFNAEVMHTISCSKSYRKVKFNGIDVYAVYSSLYKTIYTVLYPTNIDDKLRDVPRWGTGIEKECHDAYDEILETVKTQYKEFPTDKETAEYFKGCKYPYLMFTYWEKGGGKRTNKKYRLNVLIWAEVKRILKINYTNENFEDERENNNACATHEVRCAD